MKCVKCGNGVISFEMVQLGGRTRKHGTGLGGNVNNTARGMAAMGTLGMSNLFWKKSKGTQKMKFQHQKIAICQNCGHDWAVR